MRAPETRLVGLRNLAVFGRSVTFVLQNLRSTEPTFDAWYEPIATGMRDDPLMTYFKDLRNKVEKEGDVAAAPYARIERFTSRDLDGFPRPANAKAFFMADRSGGSGWEVEIAPGITEKYYVPIPGHIGTVGLGLSGVPESFGDADAVRLGERYLGELERIVATAEQQFSS